MTHATSTRRGHGKDSIYWDATKNRVRRRHRPWLEPCRDAHPQKVRGKTKIEVRDKLRELRKEIDAGLKPRRRYTVGGALEDWLAHGLDGLSERTVTLYRGTIAKALNEELGSVRLTDLTASGVRRALTALAARSSTRTVQIAHNLPGGAGIAVA